MRVGGTGARGCRRAHGYNGAYGNGCGYTIAYGYTSCANYHRALGANSYARTHATTNPDARTNGCLYSAANAYIDPSPYEQYRTHRNRNGGAHPRTDT